MNMERGIITITENGAADRSRMDDAAGNVRCVQCVRLLCPQGHCCHLQEQGTVGGRNGAPCQAGRKDKL